MSLSYLNITELKNERADAGKYLRWVESMLSWYMSSPTSTASGDDNSVVVPNLGLGRWLKQNSATDISQGLTSQILNTSTSLNTNTKNYCDTSAGSITLTLPSSATTGNLISIYALNGTSYTNKIIINRNGNNIGGVSSNREITIPAEFVDLEFVSGFGWVIKSQSNTNTLKFPMTSYSVNAPLLENTPSYLGLIDYLGKQKNTTTYINPNTTNGGTRTKNIFLATDAALQFGGNIIADNSIIFNRIATADSYLDTNGHADSFGISLLIDFTSLNLARISKIQLSIVSGRFASRFSGVRVYGANTADVSGYSLDTMLRNKKLETCFSDLRLLNYLTNTYASDNWKLSGSTYHTLIPVNSLNFYRYYILTFFEGRYLFFNQLEFFGDILTA